MGFVINNEKGDIIISEQAIMHIVGNAIAATPGVAGMVAKDLKGNVRKLFKKQNFCYGVKIKNYHNGLYIKCNVILIYGMSIINISNTIIENINNKVIQLTGIKPKNIVICVDNIMNVAD